jgi:hypothetical protein
MKRLKWTILMAMIIFLPALSYPSTLGSLRVSLIEGDVQINTEDTGDWVPASINMPLRDGDRIWVPEGSKAEVQLRDGTALRLDEKTAFDILTADQDSYQFYLSEGRAYANFIGMKGSVLQIDTPISSVRAYERAIFRIDILDDRYTDVSVYLGSVHAESNDGRTRVDDNMTLALREGFPAELGPMGPPDEWEAWNRDRNRMYADRRAPSRYLPEELQPYSTDFERNGRWVYVKEYGNVWTPTVVVSAEWAPYRTGRWVWIGGDYVWVSYEPWGWAPYHYGRWAHVPSFGWCWVPPRRGAVYWGPGFVGWVRTPTHVSWVPLAPGEIYYGRGYYGPHSVNIINVNVTTINVEKVVYRNVRVRNAVTVVHHDTFVTGRRVDVRVKENPFLRERISVGGPHIKPERTTSVPVIREIPQARRPPAQIREIRVKEIRERRPLTKERETSVLRPQSPPKEMEIKRIERKPVTREPERGIERKPEIQRGGERGTPGRGAERPVDRKPEGRIEKPAPGRPVEKGVERSREIQKPAEPPKRTSPSSTGSGPVREREIQKPPEQRPPVREVEKPKEISPRERGTVPEIRTPGKEQRPAERELRRPVDPSPGERGSGRSGESKPAEREIQRPRESRPESRQIERPKDVPAQREAIKPAEGRGGPGRETLQIQRSKPAEREAEKVDQRGTVEKGADVQREQMPADQTERTRGRTQEGERGGSGRQK